MDNFEDNQLNNLYYTTIIASKCQYNIFDIIILKQIIILKNVTFFLGLHQNKSGFFFIVESEKNIVIKCNFKCI